MENRNLDKLKEIVVVNLKSRNIDRLLRKIYSLKIRIYDVKYINRKEANIKIFSEDYNKIKEFKTIDEINIIDVLGKLKLKKIIKNNKMFFIILIMGYLFLLFLSNIIFSIDVIHSNTKLRMFITEELKSNGIKTFSFKKSYDDLNNIKDKILNDNQDKIEWLEIENIGTKYIIKLEERKLGVKKQEYNYQDIVSSKSAIIKKIEAENGVIIKKVNDYVTKGDVVISGNIYKNEEIVNVIKASGKIYGEVWYNIKVEFPIILNIKEETGNSKKIYVINFLNYTIPILDLQHYKYKTVINNKILYNRLLPFDISLQKQYELNIIGGVYSAGEALIEAIKYADNKVKSTLDEDEYIIMHKVISYNMQSEKINLEIFYKIYKNITETREIIME